MRTLAIAGAFLLSIVPVHAQSGAELAKTLAGEWTLTRIGERAVDPAKAMGFVIKGTDINGFDGCNTFGGSLLAPDRIRSTMMGCAPDTLLLPLDLANPLPQLRQARIEGDMLRMPGKAGTSLQFARKR